jgi:glycerophosphoryl diester phosphodiesterase
VNPNTSFRVQVVAHRGASGYAPETTLEAYRLALEMGVDFVEMDIHMLGDGTLVAMHDPDVKRTTDGKGRLSRLTLEQVKSLDAGSWFNRAYPRKARPEYAGLRVPTVQEIFDLVKKSSAGVYAELKNPERYPAGLESALISMIRENRFEKRSRVISFSAESIGKIKKLDAAIQTGLLISRPGRDPVGKTIRVPADELAMRYDRATPAIINSAKEQGLSVSVWTVDRKPDMERMMRIGVDRITTNYPDRLLRLSGASPRLSGVCASPGSDQHKSFKLC